jgi:MFS family permease
MAAQLISSTGSLMTALALPWFVLTTTGSPARTSLVVAAQLVPIIVFGIPSGSLVARLGARQTMLIADLLWAPLIASIPILHFAGLLSFPLLVVLAAFIGLFSASYNASQVVVLVEVVGEDSRLLSKANALFQTAVRTTYLVGPAVRCIYHVRPFEAHVGIRESGPRVAAG